MYLKNLSIISLISLISFCQPSLADNESQDDQKIPQNRAARGSTSNLIIDLKDTEMKNPAKQLVTLETSNSNPGYQMQFADEILKKPPKITRKSDPEIQYVTDRLITREVIDKLYEDIMKRLEDDPNTKNFFCENASGSSSGIRDSSNNHDDTGRQSDIKHDIKTVLQNAIRSFNSHGLKTSQLQHQSQTTNNSTSIIQDILLKSAGVFVVAGLMGMALVNLKATRRHKGIPRAENDEDSERNNQQPLNRGDSHENSHLQSTLFLNQDTRNLPSVSTVSNSC